VLNWGLFTYLLNDWCLVPACHSKCRHCYPYSQLNQLLEAILSTLFDPGGSDDGPHRPADVRDRRSVRRGHIVIDVISEGCGQLVVLVPSLGRGSEDLEPVAVGLAGARFRVLRPQPRGCGASTGPLNGLSYRDWAADLAAVIEAEQAGPSIIVGHAAGSRYARACAAHYPSLVGGVVVAAASARGRPPARLADALTVSADLSVSDVLQLAALRTAFFAPGHDPSPWLQGWSSGTMRSQRATAASGDWYTAGIAPVLDLQADDDPWRPASSRGELREALGNRVSTVVITGAAHALFAEQPQAIVQAISGWINDL
jgi:pimeloyl-ACP methyl ester carboxylesterase